MTSFDDISDLSEDKDCEPSAATERRPLLDQLEDEAIKLWRETDGKVRIVATLSSQGVPVAKVSSVAADGIDDPVSFVFSMGLADGVAIIHLCKLTINQDEVEDPDEDSDEDPDPGLVFATAEGMDAIILVVVAAKRRTEQRVLMVARCDSDWIFERLAAIEDGTKRLFAVEPYCEPPHDWLELNAQRREEVWDVVASKQLAGFTLERLCDL